MWTFYLSILLFSVIQIQDVMATGCNIVSVTSPSASTMKVVWDSYPGASRYILDLRVVNSTTIAPVVVMLSSQSTQRLVQGLRPGHTYQVTLKVCRYYTVTCTATETAMTVAATSQLTFSKAVSSSSIRFEWSSVTGADSYILFMEELLSQQTSSHVFTALAGQVDGLTPSTTYNCYVLASNSAGRSAKGRVKTIITLVQPPTGVTLTQTGKSTARVTWDPVDKVLLYQVTVSDVDEPDVAPVITTTSSTSTDISDLEPCSNYTVGVSSLNIFMVPGEPAEVTHTTSTIKAVSSVSLDYSCSSGMVTVSWLSVFGANSYRATAVDGTGAALNCTSASTSCQITMLRCGETYRVHVTAISDDCQSVSSTSTFETMPCAPAEPQVSHTCSSNVIVFSWQPTNNTLYYVATSEDNTGKVTECRTADSRCYFTNAGCGQYYTYKVLAVSTDCRSETSRPEFVRTSPCLPTNVRTKAECQSDMLITTWNAATGALSYTVEAQGNNGESYNCTSSSNSCAVTGVPCGEHLSVWIVASNDNCTTSRVLGEVAQTVPCTPTNVSASAQCSQTSALVEWTSGRGSIFHTAIAEDSSGNSHSCNSVGSSCLIAGLTCGQNYTTTVIGTNLKCNSSTSQQAAFMTAPCPPTNIEAHRDCDANHAVIVWQNHQPTGLYTATMEDQSGAQLNCTSSTVRTCKITALPCGTTYTVTVSYHDGHCASTSTPITMDSVPCGPEDVSASVSCLSGELNVSWSVSVPAENYTAIISRGMGQPLYCNSTQTQCAMGGLQCGSSYTVVVFSVTGSCYSLPSPEVTVQTAPCPPTNIIATYTCDLDLVSVSWTASDSSKYYTAVAESGGGHSRRCSSNTTSCDLSGLQCGQTYTVGVSGSDDNCTGQLSHTVTLDTEPCAPSDVSSQLLCNSGAAVVSWTPSAMATSYSVMALNGGQTLNCSSSDSSCTLTDLVCDEWYQITVTATDGTCESSSSDALWQPPVPCAPRNLTTSLSCGTNDLMVSWISSSLAMSYTVTAQLVAGSSLVSCQTNGTGCSLDGLQCGQTYSVQVEASSDSCAGLYSSTEMVTTGPCPPNAVTALTGCSSDSIMVTWNSYSSAASYNATVTGPQGFSDTCSSVSPMCSFSSLQCATEYQVEVISIDSFCTSLPAGATVRTGPCVPTGVNTLLHCDSDAATVSWTAAAGAVSYTVVAEDSRSGDSTSCRSNETSCRLSQLLCGSTYNLSVTAEDNTCSSDGAATAVLSTAPCPPSVIGSTLICGSSSSLLSWTPMADATEYTANATALSGHGVSCTSASASCNLTELQCSETYSVRVTARGSRCDSAPGPSHDIVTAPCPPTIMSTQYDCSSSTAALTWAGSAGSSGFHAQIAGGGYRDSCHTAGSTCSFLYLPCGVDLNVTVQAEGPECSSRESAYEDLQTVPCPPTNISASQLCSSRSAVVSWDSSPSAAGYNVTATGQDGHTHTCHSNSSSCELSDVHCGETYSITVTPYSETCSGNPSVAYSFSSGLCAPDNVMVAAACEHNTVSWTHVAGADMYIATATADDGDTDTCSSNHSNSCSFSSLHCGKTYTVTVQTVERGCSSLPSAAQQLKTALCPPTNLSSLVDCDSNAVSLQWAAVPGASYTLQTERMDGSVPPSLDTTPSTSHTVSGLPCGHRYAFRVAAVEGGCLSSFSTPTHVSTAPCQPVNFTARVDCGTNRGNFSWAEGSGEGFHIVEVTGEHGHVASCSSNHSSCAVKLHCGRSYSATLLTSTESCNSTKHADIHFDSAPCMPEDVVAELECNSNMMTVSWAQTPGSDDYTAWAIADGHTASCNSTSNSCSILALQCGRTYEVAVSSSSMHCDVMAGSDYKVQSAPCKPENVTVDQNCSSNALTVSWSPGRTAQNYTVEAAAASGGHFTCRSPEASCPFLNLSCGQLYTFTVTAHTNVCMSESSSVSTMTAPCPPVDVLVQLDCASRQAVVSWTPVAALMGYSVQASSSSGHNSSCSDMGSSCTLSGLQCGQQYSVVVEAMDTSCSGPASAPTTFITEPCAPTDLSVQYLLSSGLVSWSAVSRANSYSVQAATDQNLTASCDTTSTSCVLSSLQCGQVYNVTVKARNQACDSLMSESVELQTEPCPPTDIRASAVCWQLAAAVSWQLSDLAVGYEASFQDQEGRRLSCNATRAETSCVTSGLMCGKTYSVWVKALGEQYDSADSLTVSVSSEPCRPGSIQALLDCESGSATVFWQPGPGAWRYVAELTASSGRSVVCDSTGSSCEPSPLQCGQRYNVSVEAVGSECNTTAHMEEHLVTEPCPPTILSVLYDVSTAQVTWAPASGAGWYSVQAATDRGLTVGCNTSDTQCSLSGVRCGQIYNVTVKAQNEVCNNTEASAAHRLATEPCPPANVQASVACEALTSTVFWEPSYLAVGYIAYFDNQEGHATSCVSNSTSTFCQASLVCGTTYSVWVMAMGDQYNSSDSAVISVTSAPCLPSDIEVEVSCSSDGAALVSWNSAQHTTEFSLTTYVSGSLQTLCTTQSSSCNISGLSCGESYNLTLSASNAECSRSAPAAVSLNTRPCPPQRAAVNLQCGSQTAVLSWEQRSEVQLYEARAVPASGGEEILCNTTGSSCLFAHLDCGQTYSFTVTAQVGDCSSQDSDAVSLQTEPCQPVGLSVVAPCQNDSVQISWQQASGAARYLVQANGSLGYTDNQYTTDNFLLSALPCGQEYSVAVQALGSRCDSVLSSPAVFKTTPCVPWDLSTYTQCEDSLGSISWGTSDGAQMYVAVATNQDGHSQECMTNSTSCTFEQLRCGGPYTVVVRAEDERCSSLESNSSLIHMAPCLPSDIEVEVSCSSDGAALVSWTSAKHTTEFSLTTYVSGSLQTLCTTQSSSCNISGLSCGESYNLTLSASNAECSRSAPAAVSLNTRPCPPQRAAVNLQCGSQTAVLSWEQRSEVQLYEARAVPASGGEEILCNTTGSSCHFAHLDCGQTYSFTVTAQVGDCSSQDSDAVSLQTAPCVPADVSVLGDCGNHLATVSWSASRGAARYQVTALGSHGNGSCTTSDLSCELVNLVCGSVYSVEVVAVNDTCQSNSSQPLILHSGPCPPENVSVQVDCGSNNVTVSWDAVREADHFLVSLTEENGGSSEECNSTDSTCSVSSVACGSAFSVQVTSVRGQCSSERRHTHSVQTAPCRPEGVGGSLDCVTNSAWIHWDSAPGANYYTVSAVGEQGHTANCSTSTNTTCEVEDLACGVLYNFSVTAGNSRCESDPSAAVELQTAPCSLSGITAFAQCHNSSILVTWELMEGGEGNTVYTATAEASDHTYLSCNSSSSSCYLQGARCGLRYTVILAASSDTCSGLRSAPYRVSMEPCPPSNVSVQASCGDEGALVSWTPSPVADSYQVLVAAADGHVHTCNSTSSSCNVTGLHCDQNYVVSVTASHENCSSRASPDTTLHTGPCSPTGLSVTFSCSTQSAELTWTPSSHAVDYYGYAQAEDGDALYCHSSGPSCTLHSVQCGALYDFSVKASDGTCNSSSSSPLQGGAAPCPPDAVDVQLMPMQMEVQLMGFSWTQVDCGDTEYLLRLSGRLLGDGQALFDLSSYWTNRTSFEMPLPCSSSYSATLESRNSMGTSQRSEALSGTTAPCPPSDVVFSGSSSSFTVSWSASVFATTYVVYDDSVTPRTPLCTTAQLSCSLSGIGAGALRVTASNAAGESEEAMVTQVTARRRRDLSDQLQTTAPELRATRVTPAVVEVQWSPVRSASSYILVVRRQGSPLEEEEQEVQELSVLGESFILSDLSPSSSYCLSVRASFPAGADGPESQPVCVQTLNL